LKACRICGDEADDAVMGVDGCHITSKGLCRDCWHIVVKAEKVGALAVFDETDVTKRCPRCGKVMTAPDLNLVMCGPCCDNVNRQVSRGEVLLVWDEQPYSPIEDYVVNAVNIQTILEPCYNYEGILFVDDEQPYPPIIIRKDVVVLGPDHSQGCLNVTNEQPYPNPLTGLTITEVIGTGIVNSLAFPPEHCLKVWDELPFFDICHLCHNHPTTNERFELCPQCFGSHILMNEILTVWDEEPCPPPLIGFTITEQIGTGIINPLTFMPFCLRITDEVAL